MSEYLYVVGFLEDIAGAPLPGDGITARALGGTYIDLRLHSCPDRRLRAIRIQAFCR